MSLSEEELLAIVAAPIMSGWLHQEGATDGPATMQDCDDARVRAIYQARELIQYARESIHGAGHDPVPE